MEDFKRCYTPSPQSYNTEELFDVTGCECYFDIVWVIFRFSQQFRSLQTPGRIIFRKINFLHTLKFCSVTYYYKRNGLKTEKIYHLLFKLDLHIKWPIMAFCASFLKLIEIIIIYCYLIFEIKFLISNIKVRLSMNKKYVTSPILQLYNHMF